MAPYYQSRDRSRPPSRRPRGDDQPRRPAPAAAYETAIPFLHRGGVAGLFATTGPGRLNDGGRKAIMPRKLTPFLWGANLSIRGKTTSRGASCTPLH